jgi:hypothetical protein
MAACMRAGADARMAAQAAAGALALACPCDNIVLAALPARAADLAQARAWLGMHCRLLRGGGAGHTRKAAVAMLRAAVRMLLAYATGSCCPAAGASQVGMRACCRRERAPARWTCRRRCWCCTTPGRPASAFPPSRPPPWQRPLLLPLPACWQGAQPREWCRRRRGCRQAPGTQCLPWQVRIQLDVTAAASKGPPLLLISLKLVLAACTGGTARPAPPQPQPSHAAAAPAPGKQRQQQQQLEEAATQPEDAGERVTVGDFLAESLTAQSLDLPPAAAKVTHALDCSPALGAPMLQQAPLLTAKPRVAAAAHPANVSATRNHSNFLRICSL